MPFAAAVPLAISGISALAGLFGNKSRKQETESTTNATSSSMPQYDTKTAMMRDMLMDMFLGRAENNDNFFQGYANEGLNNINQGFNANQNAVENILAGRGLGRTSAGANSLISNQLNRLNQQNSLLNSIPLLADQRAQTALNDAGGFWRSIPIGQSGTQTSTTRGVNTTPGNPLAGGLLGLGTSLAGLYGEGAFGGAPGNRNSAYRTPGIIPQSQPNNDWFNYQAPKVNYKF